MSTSEQKARRTTGITQVTRGPADLVAPQQFPEGTPLRYGLGIPFQIAPRQAAMFCNLRNEGYPVGDFENGTDVILFDDLSHISAEHAISITRNDKYTDPQTGQPRIVLKHQTVGGFVPAGAKRQDGSAHPHAGTGFGVNQANDFPMKGNGYYDKVDKSTKMIRKTEVHQLAYDGNKFQVVESELRTPDAPPKAPGSDWALIWTSFVQAIPDGDDLLYPMFATKGDASTWKSFPMASGVSRWQRRDGQWQPVGFVPIAHSKEARQPQTIYGVTMHLHAMEPSLIRDTDGSLLFTARTMGDETENHALRIWRSTDSGENWQLIIDLTNARGQAPITINQAADGTPYIVSNKLGHERDWLCIWPLNADRTGLEEPITVRNVLEEFGPPPVGPVWFMDHPNGQTVQLADGAWRHLLAYRIMDRGEHAGADPAPQTGLYLEEVISAGPAIPAWRFD